MFVVMVELSKNFLSFDIWNPEYFMERTILTYFWLVLQFNLIYLTQTHIWSKTPRKSKIIFSDFAVRSVHCVGSWQDKKLVINNKYLDKFWTAIHIDTISYTTYIRHALIRCRTGEVGWVERVTVKCGHIDNYEVMIILMILIIYAECR